MAQSVSLSHWRIPALLVLAVFALRAAEFTYPLSGLDEQFYLYVGGKMSDGLLPYVDIWDRKPIVLFLIYQFASLFGELRTDIVAYHVLAALFVAVTTLALYRIVRMIAAVQTALLAALAYPIWLHLPGGAGGQAPVFFNMPMVLAAWIMVQALSREGLSYRTLAGRGAAMMLLVGCAMQIKYTAVFEGVYFGLFLLWLSLRQVGVRKTIPLAVLWVGAALIPTILAALYYWRLGHIDAFLFANFTSIAGREEPGGAVLLKRLALIGAIIAPLLIMAAPGLRRTIYRLGAAPPDREIFLFGWLVSAVAAVLIFRTYYPHYSLTILPAACAAIGLTGRMGRRFLTVAATSLVLAAVGGQVARAHYRSDKGGWATLDGLTAAIGDTRNCPFFYDYPPILYQAGHYCAPTRYIFPSHLNLAVEGHSVGISPAAETRRILTRNPEVIVTRETPFAGGNAVTWKILEQGLEARYQPVATIDQGKRDYVVYRLRSGFEPQPNEMVPGS